MAASADGAGVVAGDGESKRVSPEAAEDGPGVSGGVAGTAGRAPSRTDGEGEDKDGPDAGASESTRPSRMARSGGRARTCASCRRRADNMMPQKLSEDQRLAEP
eukprot:14113669-Alexandrium_andersonii.AAC.1